MCFEKTHHGRSRSGGCKNTIGARLKLNNARWRIRRAERIGTLRCVDASGQWENFWKPAAA